MPERFRGSVPIVGRYRGSVPILNRYRGNTLIWSSSGGKRDDFTRVDADGYPIDTLNTLGPDWTDHGPATDYKIGVEDGRARVSVPDGQLGGFWSLRTSCYRYNKAKNSTDDGFVECRFATQGDSASLTSLGGYHTQVMGRGRDDNANNGCGIQAAGGHLWISTVVNGSPGNQRRDCGTFQAGDVARLVFTGNVHTMYVNGEQRGTPWVRSGDGDYLMGNGFRSLWIAENGAKDLLGPRRFSPALDYVAMG
ncbi:hypothetical protein H7K45_27650 [Mycobacterium yunnanensis]|uniref:Uncharacterized protein n=1 Tax=Mycobacterium yunnanensis TaxID=368477 RepID=A0A9X3C5C0_9MYCO|nr:hypothetical protein [Mycobacterium yunnanensis]MCV7424327.1 hypothetical protein [Mycobacterium yunnanensis]